jgi:hypothetical protein
VRALRVTAGSLFLRCTSNSMDKSSAEKEALLNVFAAFVRPLTSVAFDYGITAGEIAGAVRRVYIEALEARLSAQNRPTTDARLAAVSGLPRSDVSALREAVREGAPLGSRQYNFDQIAVVLSVWNTHKDFLGAYGIPVDLDLEKIDGSPRPCFPDLLRIASPDVDVEVMLEGLLAAKAVEIVDGRTVRCLERVFVPKGSDVAARIERAGRFLAVVAGNFAHNLLLAEGEPFYFERVVVSDEILTNASRDAFLAVSAQKGQEMVGELDSFLSHLPPTEANASGKKYGVGIYFFEEPATNGPVARSMTTKRAELGNEKPAVLEEIDVLAPRRRKE